MASDQAERVHSNSDLAVQLELYPDALRHCTRFRSMVAMVEAGWQFLSGSLRITAAFQEQFRR